MVCDDEDEGLDFDTLNKINKETESSFDAYDVKQYPRKRIEHESRHEQSEGLELIDGSI